MTTDPFADLDAKHGISPKARGASGDPFGDLDAKYGIGAARKPSTTVAPKTAEKPLTPGHAVSAFHEVERAVAPTAAGLAGAAAGAEAVAPLAAASLAIPVAGEFAAPLIEAGGALAGGMGMGLGAEGLLSGASHLVSEATSKMPPWAANFVEGAQSLIGGSERQTEAERRRHPHLTEAAGFVPALATGRIDLKKGAKLLPHAIGGGIAGVTDLAQQIASGKPFDPTEFAINVAGGAATGKQNKMVGDRITKPIEEGVRAVASRDPKVAAYHATKAKSAAMTPQQRSDQNARYKAARAALDVLDPATTRFMLAEAKRLGVDAVTLLGAGGEHFQNFVQEVTGANIEAKNRLIAAREHYNDHLPARLGGRLDAEKPFKNLPASERAKANRKFNAQKASKPFYLSVDTIPVQLSENIGEMARQRQRGTPGPEAGQQALDDAIQTATEFAQAGDTAAQRHAVELQSLKDWHDARRSAEKEVELHDTNIAKENERQKKAHAKRVENAQKAHDRLVASEKAEYESAVDKREKRYRKQVADWEENQRKLRAKGEPKPPIMRPKPVPKPVKEPGPNPTVVGKETVEQAKARHQREVEVANFKKEQNRVALEKWEREAAEKQRAHQEAVDEYRKGFTNKPEPPPEIAKPPQRTYTPEPPPPELVVGGFVPADVGDPPIMSVGSLDMWHRALREEAAAQKKKGLQDSATAVANALDDFIKGHGGLDLQRARAVYEDHMVRAEMAETAEGIAERNPDEFKALVDGVKADPVNGIEGTPPLSGPQKLELTQKIIGDLREKATANEAGVKAFLRLLRPGLNVTENLKTLMGTDKVEDLAATLDLMEREMKAREKAASGKLESKQKGAEAGPLRWGARSLSFLGGGFKGVAAELGAEKLFDHIRDQFRLNDQDTLQITRWATNESDPAAALTQMEQAVKTGRIPNTLPKDVRDIIVRMAGTSALAKSYGSNNSALDQALPQVPVAPR